MSKIKLLSTYKQLIKALVKSERRGRLSQLKIENKRQISLAIYDKMQITRKQQLKNIKSIDEKNLFLQINQLNEKIKSLKNFNINNDKSLLYLKDSSPFKQLFQTELIEINRNNTNTNNEIFDRLIESWKDAINFLNNQREYDELMELYDLSNKYTQQEKIKATANRVGLDVPF
ncbi:similar to Saccharomyces cerevisiae YIL098C FMC1 Mitochondrial matrix protein, required for assembly or stability at high temperature of the F1 sector of mitochondrial F1F0 ATP synthase [Maudiozyma saulgeensis]|uniref:Similar to Saccharomyces cerevisiae YIL098C FMC1 Mitochondrial matrix protein, required for assembly or stability at high temperature of the F1 sector of mitochondrial F1F0 ATP synthase n=1 Tax=Maudiozyma saulgeensis TaxID=1789683 RepID=A0A1X7R525_9SACH|nr:similar to Saccharomyces cerevisiae YIL098C FMC1 Mitochondrial matrix protein, required for assembly or stability at high temperature of the F1 sector of mitochondrial F1F0 ATP synthase [Kazachstania saulgeensis]